MRRFLCLLLPLAAVLTLSVSAAEPVCVRSERTPLLPGAEYREELWEFEDGLAREVYVLQTDLRSSTLLAGTPGDDCDNDGGDGRGAALTEMLSDASAHGKHPLAAVNGDFFKTSDDGGEEYAMFAPLGVLIKDGVLLSDGQRQAGAVYFGITRQGNALMGSAEPEGDWDSVKDSLLTAVGGELWLVREGRNNLKNLTWRTSSPTLSARYGSPGKWSSYPRTAAGILADGSAVLVCVSPGFVTEGVTMPLLTELLLAMGCRDAMDLDGGSSSQLAFAEETGIRSVRAMGTSRRIGNAVLLCEGRGEAALGLPSPNSELRTRTAVLCVLCALTAVCAAVAVYRNLRRKRRS